MKYIEKPNGPKQGHNFLDWKTAKLIKKIRGTRITLTTRKPSLDQTTTGTSSSKDRSRRKLTEATLSEWGADGRNFAIQSSQLMGQIVY